MKTTLLTSLLICLGFVYTQAAESYYPSVDSNPYNSYGSGTGNALQKDAGADEDWINWDAPVLRYEYEKRVRALAEMIPRDAGEESFEMEQAARIMHGERRSLGALFKDATPQFIRERIYERNIHKYGDKYGPSIDYLRNQGKSWKQIAEGAARPGGGDLWYLKPVSWLGGVLSWFGYGMDDKAIPVILPSFSH